MAESFFAYIQQLELLAFFSGYPLIFALMLSITAKYNKDKNIFKKRVIAALPFAYALAGTLYLGLQLKNLYPDYSITNIKNAFYHPWLTAWGIMSIFFWLPFLNKKIYFALIHSLVYFYLFAKDIFINMFSSMSEKDDLRNNMKIYSISLLLNLVLLGIVWLLLYSLSYLRKTRKS